MEINAYTLSVFLPLSVIHVQYTLGYDDLSRGKPTGQGLSAPELCRGSDCQPRYTVDGNQSTCARTDDGTPVTWFVDLLDIKNIARIWIFYKKPVPKTKVYNYQVFLSNTTQWQDGFLCIDDRGPSFPFPGYVKNCPIIARFVIFKNAVYGENVTDHNFNFSQICEVKVEGCERNGVYGSYCSTPCPENCRGERCNAEDGGCFGCSDGWTGPRCQERMENKYACSFGRYGPDCREKCSAHCRGNLTCDPVSGKCFSLFSDEVCEPGWYGENCSRPCSAHCLNFSCHVTNGTCLFGCRTGWITSACDQRVILQQHLDDNMPLSVIIAVTLTILVIVIIIVIIAILVRRSRLQHQTTRSQTSDLSHLTATSTSKAQADPNAHIYEKLNFDNNHI
ncbi:uncharacterized protein LOC111127136 [Crassostrea virginica]|uniref:Delta-like protein 1 n=1 Tax=Crassostrea virginica TaxID=6565 RepID=A0A8B8DJJ2_CRAVI|nr:delta-like protein 1 [Crassostrea virginica]